MKSRRLALIGVFLGALFGGCTGFVSSGVSHLLPKPERYVFLARRISSPHHVPQFPGGVSLRFAMVQDVLHERFQKHGTVWYETRNLRTLELLKQEPESDPARWPLADDLAVGFDRLGQPGDAIPLLRQKLAQQESAGLVGRDLYTSYANLGTMLIHTNMGKARFGDAQAMEFVDEGIRLIQQSVEVNPEAHFGREQWQLAIVEFLRAASQDEALLSTFDCVGNRLDLNIERMLNRAENWTDTRYGRPNFVQFTQSDRVQDDVPGFFEVGVDHGDPARWEEFREIRIYITTVGAEEGWDEVDVPSHRSPVPFDEPVLGIIGMWRQGGGANPHFALALGEIMLRVGQRYIAWNAFERASMLADRFSPDPRAQEFLRTHCAQRQASIEETLRFVAPEDRNRSNPPWQYISLPPEPGTIERMRLSFLDELNDGLAFQKVYQKYESERIGEGWSIDNQHFFDDFEHDREPIATSVGLEETILLVPKPAMNAYIKRQVQAGSILGCGIGAVLAAMLDFAIGRYRKWRAAGDESAQQSIS